TKAITPDVNEVTITAQAPHSGYGLRIVSLTFEGDQALIQVEPLSPEEGKMYLQVITQVKAVTYISSHYKPVLTNSRSSEGTSGSGEISILPVFNSSTTQKLVH